MDISSEHRTKSIPPKPHRLVANINAAFVQKILHVPKRKRKPDVYHYREADDFGRRLEVAKGAAFCNPPKLRGCPARLKPVSYDRTPACLNQFFSDSALGSINRHDLI